MPFFGGTSIYKQVGDNIEGGSSALGNLAGGHNNIALGPLTLSSLTNGGANIAVGVQAGQHIITGSDNIAVGHLALNSSVFGFNNTVIGYQALRNLPAGFSSNTVVGAFAGLNNIAGELNTFIGFQAGDITTGDNNVAIGANAELNNGLGTIFNSIAIGANAVATQSNQIVIGTNATTSILIGGNPVATAFIGLSDCPHTYANSAYGLVRVNATQTALEFNIGLDIPETLPPATSTAYDAVSVSLADPNTSLLARSFTTMTGNNIGVSSANSNWYVQAFNGPGDSSAIIQASATGENDVNGKAVLNFDALNVAGEAAFDITSDATTSITSLNATTGALKITGPANKAAPIGADSIYISDSAAGGLLKTALISALPASGGTVTAIGVTTANGVSGVSSGGATPNLTITLGAVTPTSVNGLTISNTTGTFTLTNGKTFSVTNQLTLSGTDATVMTFPTTSATLARTDGANTFLGQQVISSSGLVLPNVNAAGNILDWYQEGSFTPTLTFGGGNTGITYDIQVGRFTRIGNRVCFSLNLELTNKGSSTGFVQINGLPFASESTGNNSTTVPLYAAGLAATAVTTLFGFVAAGASGILAFKFSAGSSTSLLDTEFNNTSQIITGGVFQAD